VADFVHLTPLDPAYPSRLRGLPRPPASITVRGGSLEATRAVAIVGSRRADAGAAEFAREIATAVARAGAVVVSGGAVGIDAAAHRGALKARGRTWVVAGTGCDGCFPPEHAALFDRIAQGPGAMVWPFSPDATAGPGAFLARNRVLVALSDVVVVVQAGMPSGALRAAACARRLRVPLWVVVPAAWMKGFDGSRMLLGHGARALTRLDEFVSTLELTASEPSGQPGGGGSDSIPKGGARELSAAETAVLAATSIAPRHTDEIAERAHLGAQAAAAALLTLALEAVVVEGPPGFFRQKRPA
jgi:DNA processing protein